MLLAPAGTVAPIPWGFIWRGVLAAFPSRAPIRSMMNRVAPELASAPNGQERLGEFVEDAFVA